LFKTNRQTNWNRELECTTVHSNLVAFPSFFRQIECQLNVLLFIYCLWSFVDDLGAVNLFE